MTHFINDWGTLLKEELEADYMNSLRDFLREEYRTQTIYPPKKDLLSALSLTPYHDVRVVILGQDPYHEPNQAHGLAFSVKAPTPPPPSLRNIFREISETTGAPTPQNGELIRWAEQGVLLLNTALSVRRGEAGSHRGKGWERFTDAIISLLNKRESPIVFLLWGADAKKKIPLITNERHVILSSVHPSPLSAHRGFFGCDHFNKANQALQSFGSPPIAW